MLYRLDSPAALHAHRKSRGHMGVAAPGSRKLGTVGRVSTLTARRKSGQRESHADSARSTAGGSSRPANGSQRHHSKSHSGTQWKTQKRALLAGSHRAVLPQQSAQWETLKQRESQFLG